MDYKKYVHLPMTEAKIPAGLKHQPQCQTHRRCLRIMVTHLSSSSGKWELSSHASSLFQIIVEFIVPFSQSTILPSLPEFLGHKSSQMCPFQMLTSAHTFWFSSYSFLPMFSSWLCSVFWFQQEVPALRRGSRKSKSWPPEKWEILLHSEKQNPGEDWMQSALLSLQVRSEKL